MREYFVSYFFKTKKGETGYGSMAINRSHLIRTWTDLVEIGDLICKKNRFASATVLAWRRFEEPAALIGEGGVR